MSNEAAIAQMQVRPPQQVEYLALSKLVKDSVAKIAGEQLPVGVSHVDFTVRVYGSMKKGEPFSMTTPMTIPWQTLFALALSKLNKSTGKSMEELAAELMVETADGLKRDPQAMETAENLIKPAVDRICKRLVEQTRKQCPGKVTAALNAVVLPAVTDKVVMPEGAFQAAKGKEAPAEATI